MEKEAATTVPPDQKNPQPVTASTLTAPPSPEIKVTLRYSGNRATIGVQRTGTDPVVSVIEAATIDVALTAVLTVLAMADRRWGTAPKNPAYHPPAPPPGQQAAKPGPQKKALTPDKSSSIQTPAFF